MNDFTDLELNGLQGAINELTQEEKEAFMDVLQCEEFAEYITENL